MIDTEIKDQLLFRAVYKCEYCHRTLLDAPWQIEHICPRQLKGTDDLQNLAVACPRCNLNKREATAGKDYVTGKTVRLFNPRIDNWGEHFGVIAGQLVGRTSIGRATAARLFRRTEQYLPPDLSWWPITNLTDERLYKFLNQQRARRLENKFSDLKRALDSLPFLDNVSTSDQQKATFAAHLLMAETLYTRSRIEDVKNAFDLINFTWRLPGLNVDCQAELLNVTSIVLQQLSTILTLEGKHSEARLTQERAANAFSNRLELIGGGSNRDKLRLKSLQGKYTIGMLKSPTREIVNEAIIEAKEGNFGALTYTADSLFTQARQVPGAETVLETLNELLLTIGYGQDIDHARNIVVRRRWWILKTFLGLYIDLDLLESDLQYWESQLMQNEIRELSLALRRFRKYRSKVLKDVIYVVESHLAGSFDCGQGGKKNTRPNPALAADAKKPRG